MNWELVENRILDDALKLRISWTFEDTNVVDQFEWDEEEQAEMLDRLERDIDTHYIARVEVLLDDIVLGSDILGSCYAYGCTPNEDIINNKIGGYLPQMIEAAKTAAAKRIAELKKVLDDYPAEML